VPNERDPADADLLASLTCPVFGVSRLRGGSKKGVNRAVFDTGVSAIIYIWDPGENYWPAAEESAAPAGLADPLSPASGLDLFCAAHSRLTELGMRVRQLCLADASHKHCPAEVAVVEDLPGPPEVQAPQTPGAASR
jgi:hypothetical protein